MRLILHTFKKDVRRLWPVAVVTWIILAVLTNADRWRSDVTISPMESWLNMAVTMAWICLTALVVLQENLVGDRDFWMTRPHRWPELLTAKLIFLALAIHGPSFLADVYVLSARGFSPVASLGDLITKQILFFGCITLPAIALASLVGNFTQFIVVVFAAVACVAVLNGGLAAMPQYLRQPTEIRHDAVRILLAASAIAVMLIQYARRRAFASRSIAAVAASATVALSAWLPVQAEFVGSQTAARIVLRTPNGDGIDRYNRRPYDSPEVAIPIRAVTARGNNFHIPVVDVDITEPDGNHIHADRSYPDRSFQAGLVATASFPNPWIRDPRFRPDTNNGWLVLQFSRPVWQRVRNARVRIHATMGFEFFRPGGTTTLPTSGTGDVADLGRCTVTTSENPFYEDMLKVLCESPGEIPETRITLLHPPSGRRWWGRLNSSFTYSPGPHETWLSPLQRGQTFFNLTRFPGTTAESNLKTPESDLPTSQVQITPEIVTGHALATIDWTNVDLSPWLTGRRK